MNQKGFLLVAVILLTSILVIVLLEYEPKSSSESKISNSINEVAEEIKDEIDDNTTVHGK